MRKIAASDKAPRKNRNLGQASGKGVDVYSASQLEKFSRALASKAVRASNGIQARKLDTYPGHFTMLTTRSTSGGAEVHQHFADFFFVVDGKANLVTGGVVKDPQSAGEGETLGSAIVKGRKRLISKGDIVHISPSVPHQLLVPPGGTFTYFVIKVRES